MNDRINLLRQQMVRQKLAVFLVTKLENIRWLSGYTGQDNVTLLITARRKFLLSMNASYQQAKREAKGWQVINLLANPRRIISGIFKKCPGRRLGFEETITFKDLALFKLLDRNNHRHYICTKHVISMLRLPKNPTEIGRIRKSCQLADAGFSFAVRKLQVGITEAELSWRMERYLRDHDAEQKAFRFVVGFGANSSCSHHQPTSRPLRFGDAVLLDFGVKYRGYTSDITRTVFFGTPDKKLADIYQRVYQTQQKTLAFLTPGVTAWEAHQFAEKMMKNDHHWVIPHSIGHGIGLEVHELPHFGVKKGPGTNIALRPGMTFTIEPGIYLPGKGGVRIEDDILMTKNGCELLTKSPKKLEQVIIKPRR